MTSEPAGAPARSNQLANLGRISSTWPRPSPAKRSVENRIAFYSLHAALQVFYLVLSMFHVVAKVYHLAKLRLLMVLYHHNRTPQLIRGDVTGLAKIPRHVAAILNLREHEEGGGIEGLVDEAGELAAWSLGAGIKVLTLYERTGVFKAMSPRLLHEAIATKLGAYFGINDRPTFRIVVPRSGDTFTVPNGTKHNDEMDLVINVLSEDDGRNTIVELTKTLADLASTDKIHSTDISVAVIDGEMKSLVVDEPDLLICFTPVIDLQGFPPWQIRLSEIFHLPDNSEVSYSIFLRALQKYSTCKVNVGR